MNLPAKIYKLDINTNQLNNRLKSVPSPSNALPANLLKLEFKH